MLDPKDGSPKEVEQLEDVGTAKRKNMNIGYPDTKNKKGSTGPLLKTNPPYKEDGNLKVKDSIISRIPKMNYNLDLRKTPTIRQT